MEVLGDNIEAIRESGIGLGLSDVEIDKCFLSALNELHRTANVDSDKQDQSGSTSRKSHQKGKSRIKSKVPKRSCMGKLCRCGLYSIIFLVVVVLVVANSENCQQWLEKKIDPWVYPITKNWRLLTLPVTRLVNLDGLYSEECLIPNPLAVPDTIPCEVCEKVTKEHTLYDVSARQFENNYMGQSQPLVIKRSHPIVTFQDLKLWYADGGDQLKRQDKRLHKAPVGLTSIDQFMSNYTFLDILGDHDFHLEWVTDAVNPSRLLRRLFPRQKFIPKKSEVTLHKILTVLGPVATSFSIAKDSRIMQNQWYVQGSGSRKILFRPNDNCVEKCPHISVTLEAGDVMYFPMGHWHLESVPVRNNKDINVIFMGSFM